jgi:MscS family membrane protein
MLMISVSVQNLISNIPDIVDNIGDRLGGVNQTIVTFFTKIAKALVMVFTVVIIVEEFGYDVTGLITGLGLGGLTFALAAQDIASNFMSGVTILLDKPFGIGDWISVGGMEGIVEEMNFRSTRIRTFDNALITVPNSKLGNDSITNWTKMNMRKTNIIIGLLYSTTRETLQAVCEDIYNELVKFEEIKTDSLVVKFDSFNASSLDVKISYNSFPIPLPAHMALKEKVQLKIMEVVERHETDFAYNTVTVVNG